MEDSQPGAGLRKYRSHCGTESYVVNWNHVDRIVDIGDKPKLNASLCEAPDEVVRIGDWNAI
jgi:hypothetical protein